MGFVLTSIQLVAGWVAILVLAFSIASLLYLLCDLAEENVGFTRQFLKHSIQIICAMYLIMGVADPDIPLQKCAIGVACHVAYLPLMRTFPVLQNPLSPVPIIALAATITNHISWFRHFLAAAGTAGGAASATGMLGFFLLFVWMVPLGFFVSMITADECLPMGRTSMSGEKKTGILKRLLDTILQRKDDVVSNVAPGLSKQY
mmetsp:Transcript_12358/g.35331  ORF Transcript_12358/g.35331 Transcript_12358/m.35331 type:complete len:203 (+) Transcript_12358:227-835(+)